MRAALVLVVALVVAAPAPARASEQRPTQAEVESEVICPTCNTTLDQSDSPIARRMKAFIARRIAAGDTKSEIKAKLVEDFGPAVLAAPPKEGFNLLAWALPIGGLLVGALVAAALAWRWTRERETVPADGPALDPELERRLDAELARFE